jgi:hypothetical protein
VSAAADRVQGGSPDSTAVDRAALAARLGARSPAQTLGVLDAGEPAVILRSRNGPAYRRGGESWLMRAVGRARDGRINRTGSLGSVPTLDA